MAGGLGEVVLGGEGVGIGDRPLQERLCLSEVLEMDLDVRRVVEKGGVLGVCSDEGGVEGRGFVVLLVAAVEASEESGNRGVCGVGRVKLFDEGEGLGGLALHVVEAGELSVEGGVVGVFAESCGEEGFGLIVFLLGN